MIKAKLWPGSELHSFGALTRKLDGVRCIFDGRTWTSRTGKPLYALPLDVLPGEYEYFSNNWNESVSHVRTRKAEGCHSKANLYRITPAATHLNLAVDARLIITELGVIGQSLSPTEINKALNREIARGGEGFVWWSIHRDELWYPTYKIKRDETLDLEIIDVIEGQGKFVGTLGAIVTERGHVGTGYTVDDRNELWGLHKVGGLIGSTVEVKCMELTKDGKLRMPRFVRLRLDK